jgi:hypothetical protein
LRNRARGAQPQYLRNERSVFPPSPVSAGGETISTAHHLRTARARRRSLISLGTASLGRQRRYEVLPARLTETARWMQGLAEQWDARLAAIKRMAEIA